MTDVADLISRWQLSPHPEGGWYREMHRSSEQVTRADGSKRDGLTSILFLLEAGAVSRMLQDLPQDQWPAALKT